MRAYGDRHQGFKVGLPAAEKLGAYLTSEKLSLHLPHTLQQPHEVIMHLLYCTTTCSSSAGQSLRCTCSHSCWRWSRSFLPSQGRLPRSGYSEERRNSQAMQLSHTDIPVPPSLLGHPYLEACQDDNLRAELRFNRLFTLLLRSSLYGPVFERRVCALTSLSPSIPVLVIAWPSTSFPTYALMSSELSLDQMIHRLPNFSVTIYTDP